jgi:hypothetical protein
MSKKIVKERALFSVELASCFDQQHHGGPYKKNPQ